MFKTPIDISSNDISLGLCVKLDDNPIGPYIFGSIETKKHQTDNNEYKYKQVNLIPVSTLPFDDIYASFDWMTIH